MKGLFRKLVGGTGRDVPRERPVPSQRIVTRNFKGQSINETKNLLQLHLDVGDKLFHLIW